MKYILEINRDKENEWQARAIAIAFDNGYKPKRGRLDNWYKKGDLPKIDVENSIVHYEGITVEFKVVFLDPSFWECLEKRFHIPCGEHMKRGCINCDGKGYHYGRYRWTMMHEFVDTLIAKKDEELFFGQLFNSHE